ncbi:regulatory protein, luxR family [Caenispirillum bisanense]|uniref:Regulatory protein, luxR family n=1 Tax=Caenispirillum bisanense TaxID=414052 RepID=A0A286GWC0_9PROT|nr:regulatory protein, luxR family [Caenispirillum bisanense]
MLREATSRWLACGGAAEPTREALRALDLPADGLTNLYGLDLTAENPLGFAARIVEQSFDMQGSLETLGDYPDREYILDSVAPHYAAARDEATAALWRVRTMIQRRYAVYDRLILPSPDGRACLSVSRVRLLVEDAVMPDAPDLTARERQCLGLLASGLTVKEMAHALGLSPRTVEKHVESLKRRFGARTTAQAVARALLADMACADEGR